MDDNTQALGQWSSHWAFILAATGAAVGLGNIWKFPYIAGENGGGAFVLMYLVCIALIGFPLLVAEITIGRRGRQNPAAAIRNLAEEGGHNWRWKWIGRAAVLASFMILSYYSVIAGWAFDYVFKTATGLFNGKSAAEIDSIFQTFTSSASTLTFWHTLNISLTILVVALGVEKGLESTVKFLFPIMLLLISVIIVYSMETGYFSQGVYFLFHPKFHKLSGQSILIALGHAFFTLSLATGSIMMYGAYLPKHARIIHSSFYIALADTLIALMAGLAIFPIVFANNLTPGAGPGLIFVTLPIAFGSMPYGQIIGTTFFIMLVFAAFTSSISLLEPSVAWLIETFHFSRKRASVISGFFVWLVGMGTVGSFNFMSSFHIFGKNFFDAMDYLTSNIMLPIGGLFTAIFFAWIFPDRLCADELSIPVNHWFMKLTKVALGIIAPLGIIIVFAHAIKII